MFPGPAIEKWFKNVRNEFGRMKKEMNYKKSGDPPRRWSAKRKGRWQNLMFLWNDIQPKSKQAADTMVGICIHHTRYYDVYTVVMGIYIYV